MTPIYHLAVLGSPTEEQITDLEEAVGNAVAMFGLRLGKDVSWEIVPETFNPGQQCSSAVVFFGGSGADHASLPSLLRRGVPVIPVVSDLRRVGTDIPVLLQSLNCLSYADGGVKRVTTALLGKV